MVFYATAEGVVFEPLSAEGKKCEHDSKKARDRLSKKIAARREKEGRERREALRAERERKRQEQQQSAAVGASIENIVGNRDGIGALNLNDIDDDDDIEEIDAIRTVNETDLEIRRIEEQLKATGIRHDELKKERDYKKYLADSAKFAKKGDSKALPANYVYQPSPADNAEKRAIVHHTGSHYHMAGSRQFQRGVRVKGVISRHSKQGAKMQAARVARRNMLSAREDARGERAAGGGKGVKTPGKAKKKKKKKSDN